MTSSTHTFTQQDVEALARQVEIASKPFQALQSEVQRIIVGQEHLLESLIIGLLCNGHLLIEGVPGLAKTTAVASLAAGIRTGFQRIQFTPDLLPADLIGTLVYRPGNGDFTVKKGPIFTNIVLADEINRAPAKVQSALLEAMQERQVTIGAETHRLPDPFLVLATQNPIEQEGTYPLPEAQVDRFMLKVIVSYPTPREERQILDRMVRTTSSPTIQPSMHPEAILEARRIVDEIFVDERLRDYAVALVAATRDPVAYRTPLAGLIQYGASPRATINLVRAAKAKAFLAGRGYVVPQDIKDIAHDVLRHRITLSYEAEAEEKTPDAIVRTLLEHVPVP
ncbi:MAG: MoxR family ATPase [Phycisphaerae bacterium]|nr:MoxR family ATPase [Phycisphaerae bacterium]